MKISKLPTLLIIASCGLLLSGCGPKKPVGTSTPTPTPRLTQLEAKDRPYISLIPRADGHEITLKISNIPSSITAIDYELIYSASDNGLEIEKGSSGSIKNPIATAEKNILLGTSSCTNGCKYKYDSGVTGGALSLTFTTSGNQVASFSTPFILLNSKDIRPSSPINVADYLSLSLSTTTTNDYFIYHKNFGSPDQSEVKNIFSGFSNGPGKGKVTTISPSTITKLDSSTITGDYIEK